MSHPARPDSSTPVPPVKSVAVLGAGMWGSVIAWNLHSKKHRVLIWDIEPGAVDQLRRERRPRSMEDFQLPSDIVLTDSLEAALQDTDLAVLAVTAQDIRRVAALVADIPSSHRPRLGWVIASKGIDQKSGKVLTEVMADVLGHSEHARIGVLSGPCIAPEVARGVPSSVVVAAPTPELASAIQSAFMTPRFRVYTQGDILGVELGGALKNVIAIAAGICDGLGFGNNTKAALITRGMAEICRLGARMGAEPKTFFGLTGMGDLVVTSFSPLSRNRRCGELLGRGRNVEQTRAEIRMAIEGIATCYAACELGERFQVDLPICNTVRAILDGKLTPSEAVNTLMLRDPKPEWY